MARAASKNFDAPGRRPKVACRAMAGIAFGDETGVTPTSNIMPGRRSRGERFGWTGD